MKTVMAVCFVGMGIMFAIALVGVSVFFGYIAWEMFQEAKNVTPIRVSEVVISLVSACGMLLFQLVAIVSVTAGLNCARDVMNGRL